MKLKKWILFLAIPLLLIAGVFWWMHDKGITVARYLEGRDGEHLFVDGNSPVTMSDRGPGELFQGLESGDKILIVHDGIEETYPGRTGAYLCLKLESGDVTDIPDYVLDDLAHMGWLEEELQEAPTLPEDITKVEFSYENVTMTLSLPQDWEYLLQREDESALGVGIEFWPQGQEGKLCFYYCPSGFGVCGTGLKEKKVTLADGREWTQGTYDNAAFWDFMSCRDGDDTFVILNQGADSWLDQHADICEMVIGTATFSVNKS